MLQPYSDETKVILSADKKKEALKKINEIMSSLDFIRQLVKEDNLVNNNVWSCMGVNEHLHAELSELLGYNSILAEEVKKRSSEIREKNTKIAQLEQMLGEQTSPDAVMGALRLYEDIFSAWLDSEGFHYASLQTHQWCIEAEFSAEMDFTNECAYPKHDVYRRMWNHEVGAQQKVDCGWDIHIGQFYGEMLDTDNNKKHFSELIMSTFPNARITGFGSRRNDYGSFSMRPVVCIPYSDVAELYAKSKQEGNADTNA